MPQPIECHNSLIKALIALGSNATSPAGRPIETVLAAFIELHSDSLHVTAKSRLFMTPCMPAGAGPDYINAVVAVETTLSPTALLERCHEIEATFSRTRSTRWGARSLDLDIIDFGGKTLPDKDTFDYWKNLPFDQQTKLAPEKLILPHPRMQDRPFVLVPMKDVAPDYTHPVTGQTLDQMLQTLPAADITAITPHDPSP